MNTEPESVELTRSLIAFDTINPPGRETQCARFVGDLLNAAGVAHEVREFGPERANLIARIEGADATLAPLVLTGHLDTVPLGSQQWSIDPFRAEIVDGRLFGRGASDMKSGVAAMITAFVRVHARLQRLDRGVVLLLTGGEEVGCQGAVALREHMPAALGAASGMIVGEPTSNQLAPGHKGALFMRATTRGVTAHSSMPQQGVNAIYAAARAVTKIETLGMPPAEDAFMGAPTINVGMIRGGLNANSVPDHAEFTIDVRSGPQPTHAETLRSVRERLGSDVDVQPFIEMPAVYTAPTDAFAATVAAATRRVMGARAGVAGSAIPFFSDASVLQPHYRCPTVILGPGEPGTAHQTDEFCFVDRIREAEQIYFAVIQSWCAGA